jgi:hypothetical protein
MGAMDYYRLLSKHIEKVEELERIQKQNEGNK